MNTLETDNPGALYRPFDQWLQWMKGFASSNIFSDVY